MNSVSELIQLSISNRSASLQQHADLELIYIIEGKVILLLNDISYEMEKDDYILVNTSIPHRIQNKTSGLIGIYRISYPDLCQTLGRDQIRFDCNTILDSGYRFTRLRDAIQASLLSYAEDSGHSSYLQQARLLEILGLLVDDFLITDSGLNQNTNTEERLVTILDYIHANYNRSLTLNDISAQLFLSPSGLSRYFQNKMGMTFIEYVNDYRLKMAEQLLTQSKESVTRIAMECGFSNSSALNHAFRKKHEMTPTEYRVQYHQSDKDRSEEEPASLQPLAQLQQTLHLEVRKTTPKIDSTHVFCDISKGRPYRKWENKILNVGPIALFETAVFQRQILMLKDMLGIEYLRFWSITAGGVIMMDPSKKQINFNKLDTILDVCVENKLKVFFDLSPRERTEVASEHRRLYTAKGDFLFANEEDWVFYISSLLHHVVNRYGLPTVREWIFEFAFFLNEQPYYISSKYSSRNVWEKGYQLVKKTVPGAQVAGPGLVVMDEDATELAIRQFFEIKHHPDIFTFFQFAYKGKGRTNEFQRMAEQNFMSDQLAYVNRILDQMNFKGLRYSTDWNYSLANRSYIQDSCFRGTFILRNATRNFQDVDTMGLFYATDLLNLYHDSDTPLHGGGGLITKDGICKPACYAFQFLNQMGSYLLQKGDGYLVTCDEFDHIQILAYNHKHLSPSFYLRAEDSFKPEEIRNLYQNRESVTLEFEIAVRKKNGRCIMRQKHMSEDRGSVLDHWIHLGCEKDLPAEDIQLMRQFSMPHLTYGHIDIIDGRLHLKLELLPLEMKWLSLTLEG